MYLQLKNQNLYYQKVGKGKNLVLLHGWGQDSSSFWGIVDHLKENFTLYLVDLPGFGKSDKPQKAFKVRDYSQIIYEFIKKLNIKNPTVLGHSVGGRIAIKLAAEKPEVLERLILEDSAGIKPEPSKINKSVLPLAKVFHYLFPKGKLKEFIRHKFYSGIESDYETVGELKETFSNILNEDLSSDLSKIKTKTLLIWGEKDRAVPLKYGKRMYRLIPNSKIEVIEGIGHFPHLENPERFIYYVEDFV